jgi:LuxR family maltose regulon positive regulatory protein
MMIEGSGLLLLGEIDEARARLEAAANSAFVLPGSETTSLAQLALIAASRGDWDEANRRMARVRELTEAHPLANQAPQALVLAVTSYLRVHFGDIDGARHAALQSRRLITRLNHLAQWMGIEARIVLSRVELALGDVEAARVLAREARELAARMTDAGVLPERIDTIFTEIASNARADAVLGAAPLTTAELRVLAYLPTHLSFQAMAEDLFVSRNTVKTQAISIYRKLGVQSRGDAVAQARELGLLDD